MSNQGGPSGIPGQGQGHASGSNVPAFDQSQVNTASSFNPASLSYNPDPSQLQSLLGSTPLERTKSGSLLPLPLPNTTSSTMSMNPAQLAQLTEYHRQQQLQREQREALRTHSTPGSQLLLPEHIRQKVKGLGTPGMHTFLRQWIETDEGRQFNRSLQQQADPNVAPIAGIGNLAGAGSGSHLLANRSSASPSHPTLALPPSVVSVPNSTSNSAAPSNTSTPERRGSSANVPISQAFTPAQFNGTPSNPVQARPTQTPGNNQLHPQLNRPIAPTPSNTYNPSGGTSQWSSSVPQYRSNPDYRWQPAPAAAPRRREDGMRGTMRSELARLMYASGDVENPDTDTIDYMEDLVVDWLADLCAPPPPIRATPSVPYTTPRLDYEVIRHRLSRPSMRKYLDRFEYMEFKAIDMRAARRVARGNFEPLDQKDLDRQLEKGFLDGEDSNQAAEGQGKKKRKYKRPPVPAQAQGGDGNAEGKEKKKPGPKKGWKKGAAAGGSSGAGSRAPSGPPGRGTSVKPEEK